MSAFRNTPTDELRGIYTESFTGSVDLAKAGISAALGAIAMGALVLLGIATGGVAVVVGAIILSVVIGLGIDWLDKKTGATDSLNNKLRNGAAYLQDKLSMDYQHYDGVLEEALASNKGYA